MKARQAGKVSMDRRGFIKTGTALTALQKLSGRCIWGAEQGSTAARVEKLGPMAYSPATWYRPEAKS